MSGIYVDLLTFFGKIALDNSITYSFHTRESPATVSVPCTTRHDKAINNFTPNLWGGKWSFKPYPNKQVSVKLATKVNGNSQRKRCS